MSYWAVIKERHDSKLILCGPFGNKQEVEQYINEKHSGAIRSGYYGAASLSELLRQLEEHGEMEVAIALNLHEFFFMPSVLRILESQEFQRARDELSEALKDLARGDTTGAAQHAAAGLEAIAREITGRRGKALGLLIDPIIKNLKVLWGVRAKTFDKPKPAKKSPKPAEKPSALELLGEAIKNLWKYVSEVARHGREGERIGSDEAMLVVGIFVALAVYLASKKSEFQSLLSKGDGRKHPASGRTCHDLENGDPPQGDGNDR